MKRSWLFGACAFLVSALAPARHAPLMGAYELVAVGGREPGYWGGQGNCDVPTSSLYTFTERRWTVVDTVRWVGQCRGIGDSIVQRRDSGYYRIQRDTLNLWVDNTRIGLNGWIDRAFIRGDTLLFRADEFDPGDYVYVRRRR